MMSGKGFMGGARSTLAAGKWTLLGLALAAPATAAPPAVSPVPSEAQIRAAWEGGSWRTDRFKGGGWMSGYKTTEEYFDTKFTPPNPVPLRPPEWQAYLHIRSEYGRGVAIFAPYAQCHPGGMPYLITLSGYGGYQAVVDDHQILFIYGNNDYRRIYYRGHAHPDPETTEPTYNGDSIAHWEGSTMVVDTTNIRGENTQIEPHMPKPEGSHIVERYTPVGPGRFAVKMTMTNPRFMRPWVVDFFVDRDRKGTLKQGLCTDENRWAMGPDGALQMNGADGKPLEKAED